ncbi:anaerobic ribonucleoside-triphosphate reductase activating protein [Clostridium rectalis]|uniref:anaerobic ribonucleoside-triphosphate reductase activating protein n=1 Tax=Clostridium rectalis TaxID=2040295 RepID=UPI003C12C435
MRKLQIAGFLDNSLVNGSGLRSVVFVAGCRHNCKGCHNLAMQDFKYGDNVNIKDVFFRIKKNIPLIKGVTFSGGEPFEQANGLKNLATMIKGEKLNIWCYTGYTFEYILKNLKANDGWEGLLYSIDVLVDGRFDINKMKDAIKYTGSSNQRIIDVKESIKKNKVIILKT